MTIGTVRRPVAWAALLAALLPAGACSVADNLSADEMLAEIDGIVRVDAVAGERRLYYVDRAPVSAWYQRLFLTVPIRAPLRWLFGASHEASIENPAAHVRELLRELPDETGGDLAACVMTAVRCGWIAELEASAQSRIVAVDGLAAMAQQLALPLFGGALDRFGLPPDPARVALARAGVQGGRPENRRAGAWQGEQARAYREALGVLTAAPLDDWAARLVLVEELLTLHELEPEADLRPITAAAVRAALQHLIEGVLLRQVQSRAPEYVETRLCALEQVRRLGGPAAVPLLLAVMAASPERLARGEPRFDPDPLIQLRLIRFCGQLSGELALRAVRLPGRADWEAIAPADFLATTILTEQAYYSKLRTPALVALTWSLRRPRLDPDPTWVREWREGRAR